MPKAAYCSQCGENVYLTDDGRCPKGHGPESLSNYYDAPDPQPVDQGPVEEPVPTAVPGAPPPTTSSGTKVPLVIAIVIIALLLCCCISAAVGTWVFDQDDSATTDPRTEEEIAAVEELEEELAGEYPEVDEELTAAVDYFYPSFRLHEYALAGEAGADLEYHVIAESEEAPGFYITVFMTRTQDMAAEGADDPAISHIDEVSGAVWLHPQTISTGLAIFAGPDSIVPDSMRTQIMEDFQAARSELLFATEFDFTSNVDVGFRGIGEADLDLWYEDFNTWESLWESDLANGVWVETSFEYLGG
jgi:hypothetical protein